MCQMLDHCTDAQKALGKVRSLLAPDGLLYVDILDLRGMLRVTGLLEACIKVDHPYYFTEHTARACLADAGLSVLGRSYNGTHIGFLCALGDHPQRTRATRKLDSARVLFDEIRVAQTTVPR